MYARRIRHVFPCSPSFAVAGGGGGVGTGPAQSPASPACAAGLTWAAFHSAAGRGQHGPMTGLCELSQDQHTAGQGWGLQPEPPPTRPQVKGTECAWTPSQELCSCPYFLQGPSPAHLKEETPKGRDGRWGWAQRAPAVTIALRPRFSVTPLLVCPGPWYCPMRRGDW